MRYLIIGASSGLGRELAYVFARNNHDLVICSRNEKDLIAIKSDIEIKHGTKVECIEMDFSSLEEVEKKVIQNSSLQKNLEGVLFPVGMIFENDSFPTSINDSTKLNNSNYHLIAHVISNFYKNLNKDDKFSFVGFGSVSGYLGRKANVNYAAAKRALESFFESLSFSTENTGVKVQFYVLGYMDTNLAFGNNLKLPKGKVYKLAEIVYKNRNKKYKKIFYPSFWFFICKILLITPLNILRLFKNFLK